MARQGWPGAGEAVAWSQAGILLAGRWWQKNEWRAVGW